MIRTVILKIGSAFVVAGGFAPAPEAPSGDLFRIDVAPSNSSLFRRAA